MHGTQLCDCGEGEARLVRLDDRPDGRLESHGKSSEILPNIHEHLRRIRPEVGYTGEGFKWGWAPGGCL